MNVLRVVDAGPLIGLAKIGRLDILTAGDRTVLVPETVAREVENGPGGDWARQALRHGWGTRTTDVPVPANLAAFGLDAGEEAALALALSAGGLAVLDDGDGRKAARALNIAHIGTTGIVVEAKRQGHVLSASALLHQLRRVGIYLPTDAILEAVLQTVGEEWPGPR